MPDAPLTAATIGIGQATVAYSFFLPKIQEVRGRDDTEMRADVLLGQAAAATVSLTVGALLAWMTGSYIPFVTTLFIAFSIAAFYQYAMVTSPGEIAQ